MPKVTHEIPLVEKLSEADIKTIAKLVSDLRVVDIHVEFIESPAGNLLAFSYAQEKNKRNAGRKKKALPSDSITRRMTQNQLDDWLLNNPIKTIEEELDIGRATAFRRRAEARERLSYAIISLREDDAS